MVTIGENFWAYVDRANEQGCWEWLASKDSNGYGTLRYEGGYTRSHRVAYELTVGPIPDGMVIDHLCRNTSCANPNHLEVVSRGENVLRGIGPSGKNARATHCPQGHQYDFANTYVRRNGWRGCKICRKEQKQALNRRNQ